MRRNENFSKWPKLFDRRGLASWINKATILDQGKSVRNRPSHLGTRAMRVKSKSATNANMSHISSLAPQQPALQRSACDVIGDMEHFTVMQAQRTALSLLLFHRRRSKFELFHVWFGLEGKLLWFGIDLSKQKRVQLFRFDAFVSQSHAR